ncbi:MULTISPECIES: SRPBCC domain-containing protein [unclassified Devosia]|jgi:hypothetical protein|uniref:SRPBCC family protein n=1 Tax=unclassified Devosia TaxID=196773 RepID=UPI00086A6074|nr:MULTISPECIES: SRPBCC domain-containing protein [unclassified Devosia]MBN9363365.1 SRPBCC domain-containing protein [Devosia sp.]ODS81545.1 MAG: hypothetical protein ABS47_24190 [Devosia sp. SCN 66-27]OJX25194.1 MAG: hypothetical protein BGO83_09975 [Devosia sp. 66-14]
MTDKQDRTIVEMTIAAPIETVWAAMREPEQLLNWFGWDADTLRDEIKFIFADHAEADEANRIISFGEYEGVRDWVELHPTPGGTVLRVVRSGPVDADWNAFYEDTWEGWITFFQQLRFLLERHPGAKRRTLFLSGRLETPGALPISALGLEALRTAADGSSASSTLPLDETVSGTVWHHSDRQVAMSVEGWGDGLMVITDQPAPNAGPNGGGTALLTTFGLSDAAFAALEQRWTAWWRQRFVKAG